MSSINKQTAIDALEKRFQQEFKKLGYEDYNSADERTQLVCDGILEAIDVIDTLPFAKPVTDCISRQAAIDEVDSETVSTNPEHFKSSEKFIKSEPTTQPEIVRCGDCAWYGLRHFCHNYDCYGFGNDDFCSQGVRRRFEHD